MQKRHILILDSGIGGLTIAAEVSKMISHTNLLYIADHKHFPYGVKTEEWLENRLHELIQDVAGKYTVDLVIVACNTASTVVLPWLRERFPMPIVGVVPAIKPAGAYSKEKAIGILATEGTVRREYTDQLIKNFASDCKVEAVASRRLVEIAEEKFRGTEPSPDELREICQPFFNGKGEAIVDVVVLGCTHFPFLKEALQKHVSSEIKWIDSGLAVAQRVKSLLPANDGDSSSHLFMSTGETKLGANEYLASIGFREEKFALKTHL